MFIRMRRPLSHHLIRGRRSSLRSLSDTTAPATAPDTGRRTQNETIKLLLRSSNPTDQSKALSLLSSSLQSDSPSLPESTTCSTLFHTLSRRDHALSPDSIPLLLHLADRGVFPTDSFLLTQLVNKLCYSGHAVEAWDFLQTVRNRGGGIQIPAYNALLAGFSRDRDLTRMNKIFSQMKQIGFQPNLITYGILMNILAKWRRVDEALKMLDELSEPGSEVKPDVVLYNTVVDGFCKAGRVEEGFAILGRMRLQRGCEPNVVTYNSLIDCLCKCGEIDKAKDVLDVMEKENVSPNVITLNALVSGMCRNGRISSALDFVRRKRAAFADVKSNAVTYSTLIGAFLHSNNVGKAMELYDEMVREGQSLDAVIYFTLISGLTQARRIDDACSVALDMRKNGLRLDTKSYNILISGFCRKKNLEKAWELFGEMEAAGVMPDVVTYNTLIDAASKAADFATARQLLSKMTGEGQKPTVFTYGSLINGFCMNGKLDKAMEIFQSLKGSLVEPNNVIYNILIDSLCKEGKVDEAILLMAGMRDKGVSPNVITYNSLFKGLCEKNMVDEAFELMNKMKEQGCDPNYVTMKILMEWMSAIGEVERLRCFVQGKEAASLDTESADRTFGRCYHL